MKIKYLFLLVFLSQLLSNCTNKTPVESELPQLVAFNERCFGGFNSQNANKFIISNRLGFINILGNGLADTARTYLYKTVKTEKDAITSKHFNDIVFEKIFQNDSVICLIDAPENSGSVEYGCELTVEIDGALLTWIDSPNKGVSFFYMDTTVYVLDSGGDIEIKQHNGSCQVNTSHGDIEVEMIMKENGFCRCITAEGNIRLEIPGNSSAAIYAQTGEGVISCNNLNISNKQESPGLLTGSLSTGSGEIHLETQNGDIEISGFSVDER